MIGQYSSVVTKLGVLWLLPVLCLSVGDSACSQTVERPDPSRFAEAMATFARQDDANTNEPSPDVVFVGSSSIRLWALDKHFSSGQLLNRGFGGSHISDCRHFADRLVVRHRPRLIVLYAGDNDIAYGLGPKQVVRDFQEWMNYVRSKIPSVRIAFISIKPSLARWDQWDAMRQANQQIEAVIQRLPNTVYLDVATPMIGENGRPRPELFVEDGLHLNDEGYRVWTKIVVPEVTAMVAARNAAVEQHPSEDGVRTTD